MTYHPSVVSLIPHIILIVALIFAIGSYVVNGIALFLMGRKAGISWAWVAWIPGAQNFVIAKMARWKAWPLFPILTLVGAGIAMTAQMIFIGIGIGIVQFMSKSSASASLPHPAIPSTGIVMMIIMFLIEGVVMLVAVFAMIQEGQVLERFGYSYAWIMWNFLPAFGTIVFFVILLRIAFRKEIQYQASGMRTVFGSMIRGSEI
jgi:hypothetical protein